MFDKQLTDKRVAESVMQTLGMEISFEDSGTSAEGERVLEFTIFSLDPLSGRGFIFGTGKEGEVWSKVREIVEEYETKERR